MSTVSTNTSEAGRPAGPPELAASTRRAYLADWRSFEAWADAHATSSLPASPGAVVRYLEELAAVARPATLRRRLASIAWAHRSASLPSPTDDPTVRAAWARLRGPGPARGATPLTVATLRRSVARLPPGLAGARDRVVLLLGFAGALRRSELVGLDVEHLTEVPDGLVLRLATRKVRVTRGVGPTCPVRAVAAWRREARVDRGPLLHPVDRSGRVRPERLGAASVGPIVRAAVARAGLDAAGYSAHSLRAGLVAEALAAGVPEAAVAAQAGLRRLPGPPRPPLDPPAAVASTRLGL